MYTKYFMKARSKPKYVSIYLGLISQTIYLCDNFLLCTYPQLAGSLRGIEYFFNFFITLIQ